MADLDSHRAMRTVSSSALDELRVLWDANVVGLTPGEAKAFLDAVLPALGERYGYASASLAVSYFEATREAAGVAVPYQATLAPLPTQGRYSAMANWALAPVVARQDWASAYSLLSGGFQRTVTNAHRDTTIMNSIIDRACKGWQRVGQGETCDFCRMLIDRGGVYTGDSVLFKSHDHCRCVAVASWDESRRVSTEAYKASKRSANAKASRNEAARFWIDANYR